MSLKILLADSVTERMAAVEDSLARAGGVTVFRAPTGEPLPEVVAKLSPDVVIVDMALPDRDALDSIRELTQRVPRPVVMFVDRDDPDFMTEAIEAGVSSYNVVGMALPEIKPIVAAAVALFQRYRRVEAELEKAKITIEERRTISSAKAILMRQRGMKEAEAYAWMRRRAMDENRRIVDIAVSLIAAPDTATPAASPKNGQRRERRK